MNRKEFSKIINNFNPSNLVFYEKDTFCYLKLSVRDIVKNQSTKEKKEFIISVSLKRLSDDSSIKEVFSLQDSLIEFTKEEISDFLFNFDNVFNNEKAILSYLRNLNLF